MGSVRGRELRCRVAPRGGALDRGFARTAQRVVPIFTSVQGQHPEREDRGRRGHAEAGGSPSSEAPPGDPPQVIDRRAGRAASGIAPARGRPGTALGNRAVRRVLVVQVGCRSRRDASFSHAVASRGVTLGERVWWDSLKRPSSL